MLKSLLKLLPGKPRSVEEPSNAVFQLAPPMQIEAPGLASFDFSAALSLVNDLPTPDWSAVGTWVASIPEPAAQAEAWARAELAWLAHLQVALGKHYHLAQHDYALLLSPLEPRVATATVTDQQGP